jgi:hypothetical protein
MLAESDPFDATSLNDFDPLSVESGVPERVRLVLSTSSHDGAFLSEYLVSESVLEKVLSANTNLNG